MRPCIREGHQGHLNGQAVASAVWPPGLSQVELARRAAALSERIETERALIEADLARLRAAIEETKRLWLPYRRILRWVRHPLVIALLESYARRRVRAR